MFKMYTNLDKIELMRQMNRLDVQTQMTWTLKKIFTLIDKMDGIKQKNRTQCFLGNRTFQMDDLHQLCLFSLKSALLAHLMNHVHLKPDVSLETILFCMFCYIFITEISTVFEEFK